MQQQRPSRTPPASQCNCTRTGSARRCGGRHGHGACRAGSAHKTAGARGVGGALCTDSTVQFMDVNRCTSLAHACPCSGRHLSTSTSLLHIGLEGSPLLQVKLPRTCRPHVQAALGAGMLTNGTDWQICRVQLYSRMRLGSAEPESA